MNKIPLMEKSYPISKTPAVNKMQISTLALSSTGRNITANTVTLGILVGLTKVVSKQAIEQAVKGRRR